MSVERRVTDWLNASAPAHAPERLLKAALGRVAATPQERSLWRGTAARRASARPILVLAATLAAVGLIGGLAVFGGRPQPTDTAGLRTLQPGGLLIPRTAWLGLVATPDQPSSSMQLTLPAGWTTDDLGRIFKEAGTSPTGMGIEIGSVSGVYADPCHWTNGVVDLEASHGPGTQGVPGLANALSRGGAAPESTSLADLPGYRLALNTPTDLSLCDSSQYHLWRSINTSPGLSDLPGQVDEVWLLETDADAIVVDAWHFSGTSAADLAEQRQILDSMKWTPAP